MRQVKPTDRTPSSDERQIAGYIAKFDPKKQKLIRSVRKLLRKRFPTANELVYDYSRNFVISYSPTERGLEAIVAMTAAADGVRLHFNYGASLPDRHKILMGDRGQTRFITLESAGILHRPEVESLMTAAVRRSKPPLRKSGSGMLIIKPSSSKQRPRRRTVKR